MEKGKKLRLKIKFNRWFKKTFLQPTQIALYVLSLGIAMYFIIAFLEVITPAMAQMPINDVNVPRTLKSGEIQALQALDGTPLEEVKPFIAKASNYYGIPANLYIGIANAETSLARNNFKAGSFNPVGVKPSGGLKYYSDWEHSINAWFHLIKEYYWEEGLDTCAKMMRKYVGYNDQNWIRNCEQYYN